MRFKNILLGIFFVRVIILHIEAKYNDRFIFKTEKSYTSQETVRLTSYCFKTSAKNAIVLVDENHDSFFSNILYDFKDPIHLLKNDDEGNIFEYRKRLKNIYVLNKTNIEKSNNPISSAYISISNTNTTSFSNTLELLRDSILWNHQAYFFIANFNSLDGCQMPSAFLDVAWTFSLLSVIYLCNDSNDQIFLYTFNPYASIAPQPWKKVQSFKSFDRPWTLFQLSSAGNHELFMPDENTCSTYLFFDKVKQLHGYNLKTLIVSNEINYRYDKTKVGYERFDGIDYRIMSTALKHVNATLTVKDSTVTGHIDDQGKPYGLLQDIMTGRVDIFVCMYLIRDYWRLQTHSSMSDSVKIVTLKTPLTYIEKLSTILTLNFFTFLFITSLICVMILKHILKVSTSLALLECMRIFSSTPALTMPRYFVGKILLIACIILEFAFSTFILSSFAAINTSDNTFTVIDTAKELIKSNLTIFGLPNYLEMIPQKEIRDRLNLITAKTYCSSHLLKGNRVACIEGSVHLKHIIQNETIHISKDNLVERTAGFIFSEDSPLISTFHSIFLKLNEGGFIGLIYQHELLYESNKYYNEVKSKDSFDIEYFMIAFLIIIGSWLLGILALCVEIIAFKLIKLIKLIKGTN